MDNVVAKIDLGNKVDLSSLSAADPGYRCGGANAGCCTRRLDDFSVTVQVFSTGKVVFMGTSPPDLLIDVRLQVIDELGKAGVDVSSVSELEVCNVVVSGNTGRRCDLSKLVSLMDPERIEYEPEQFPSLIYRMEEPAATIMLFNTGKIIVTGLTDPLEISDAADRFDDILEKVGITR